MLILNTCNLPSNRGTLEPTLNTISLVRIELPLVHIKKTGLIKHSICLHHSVQTTYPKPMGILYSIQDINGMWHIVLAHKTFQETQGE